MLVRIFMHTFIATCIVCIMSEAEAIVVGRKQIDLLVNNYNRVTCVLVCVVLQFVCLELNDFCLQTSLSTSGIRIPSVN